MLTTGETGRLLSVTPITIINWMEAGKLPFEKYGDGGSFNYKDGKPEVVDTFTLRFSLMVPHPIKCPMPPAGSCW